MINFQASAAQTLLPILLDQCVDEWANMHHNAIIYWWPSDDELDFCDTDSANRWHDFLSDQCSQLYEDLQNFVEEDFGFSWKFFQHGRGGGTIYPNVEFVRGYPYQLDPDHIVDISNLPEPDDNGNFLCGDLDVDDWTDAVQTAKNYLAAFKFINKTVRAAVDCLPSLWKEHLEYLENLEQEAT